MKHYVINILAEHTFITHHKCKRMSAPAKTTCDKCEKREPSCYCRVCGFLCDSCKKPHEWKEFSSHEIISLDQLAGDVPNLVPPVNKILQYSKHPKKELDLFCETCEEIICQNCNVRAHRNHQDDLATDAFPKNKDVIVASLQLVEQQLASDNKALEGFNTRCDQIRRTGSQGEILDMKKQLVLQVKEMMAEFKPETLVPEEQADLTFANSQTEIFRNLGKSILILCALRSATLKAQGSKWRWYERQPQLQSISWIRRG